MAICHALLIKQVDLLNIQFTLEFTDVQNMTKLTLLESDSAFLALLCSTAPLHATKP